MITTLDEYFTAETEEKQDELKYQPPEESEKKQQCNKEGWSYEPIKEIAKWIKKDLKAAFNNNIKVSVTSESYPRSINVKIKQISKEHIMTYNDFKEEMTFSHLYDEENYPVYLAPYENKESNFKKYHLTEEAYQLIQKTINKYNYDNSDPYTDYFDVNYYDYWGTDTNMVVTD